jgi:hypothetical protein
MIRRVLYLILAICVVSMFNIGCASTPKARPHIPYSYPVYAMPHGSEFVPGEVAVYPLELPIIPILP